MTNDFTFNRTANALTIFNFLSLEWAIKKCLNMEMTLALV